MLLLAAMVGCIVIAMKAGPQQPSTSGKELENAKRSLPQGFELADQEDENVLPLEEDIGGASR
jgi:hypothetical protein